LNENGKNGISQEILSTMIFSNKNNTSSILKRMEGIGYIKRVKNGKDQREKIISCTDKGGNIFKLAECKAADVRHQSIEKLTRQEQSNLCKSLEKINSKLKSLK
jgi:DNA-binding MarR family transcriptional regulator